MFLLTKKYPQKPLVFLVFFLVMGGSLFLAWKVFGNLKFFFYDMLILFGIVGVLELYFRIQENIDTKQNELRQFLVGREEFFTAQKDIAIVLKNLAQFLQNSELSENLREIRTTQERMDQHIASQNLPQSFKDIHTRLEEISQEQKEEIKVRTFDPYKLRESLLHGMKQSQDQVIQNLQDSSAIEANLSEEIRRVALESSYVTQQDKSQLLEHIHALSEMIRNTPQADLEPLKTQLEDIQTALTQVQPPNLIPLLQRVELMCVELETSLRELPDREFSAISHQFDVMGAQIENLTNIDQSNVELHKVAAQIQAMSQDLKEKLKSLSSVDALSERDRKQISRHFQALEDRIIALSTTEKKHESQHFNALQNQIRRIQESIESLPKQNPPQNLDRLTTMLESLKKQTQQLAKNIEALSKVEPDPKLERHLAQNYEFQKGVVQLLETMEAELQKQKSQKKK